MRRSFAMAMMSTGLLAGCAGRTLPPPPAPPTAAVENPANGNPAAFGARCPPVSACAPKDKSPYRQYYDAHHRRYYYYDPLRRRYFWENGQPKA